ncbi:hypothetical protein Clacol_000762 [Clathrus columnatus]|uniref:Uncharacterized protein n=1 Tax=Clathrus columnatus TaxID=1419009 RepID=A0AAV4ZX51_9AGAM|nr:hypothetical protein Clacol_000762 [Clathrus columnatus]
MPLGILEDKYLENVPGTVPLLDLLQKGLARSQKHEKGIDSNVILVPQPSDDPRDPLNWPRWRKECLFWVLSFGAGLVRGAIGHLLNPGFVILSKEWGVSVDTVAATAPLAVKYGRRPVYIVAALLLFFCSIWSALSQGLSSFTGSRVLQGFGEAPFEALVTATIADIYFYDRDNKFETDIDPGAREESDVKDTILDEKIDVSADAMVVQVEKESFFKGLSPWNGHVHRETSVDIQPVSETFEQVKLGYMGWALMAPHNVHWMGPVMMFTIINVGQGIGTTGAVAYIIDVHRKNAAECFALINFIKDIILYGFARFANSWVSDMVTINERFDRLKYTAFTHTFAGCTEDIWNPRWTGCRRDEFPLGYAQDAVLPPKCPPGQFCPDEGDACQPLLPVGSPCQLNRDDECAPPPNFKELANKDFNHNGSVCINFQCFWANATLNEACEDEQMPYIAFGSGNEEFIYVVSRGNCVPGLYCDAAKKTCLQQKLFGDSCTADKECQSNNCLPSLTCGVSPQAPKHFAIWVYIVVGLGIIGGMVGTLVGLYLLHRRTREEEREKRTQYWREQNAFRQNILQMRDTAKASLLSLSLQGQETPRSSTYNPREHITSEDSSIGILRRNSAQRAPPDDNDQESIHGETPILLAADQETFGWGPQRRPANGGRR